MLQSAVVVWNVNAEMCLWLTVLGLVVFAAVLCSELWSSQLYTAHLKNEYLFIACFESAQELDPRDGDSSAGTQTHILSITSLVLWPLSYLPVCLCCPVHGSPSVLTSLVLLPTGLGVSGQLSPSWLRAHGTGVLPGSWGVPRGARRLHLVQALFHRHHGAAVPPLPVCAAGPSSGVWGVCWWWWDVLLVTGCVDGDGVCYWWWGVLVLQCAGGGMRCVVGDGVCWWQWGVLSWMVHGDAVCWQ